MGILPNSKWKPGNLMLPSPVWVKIMRIVVITGGPIIIAQVPNMPIGLDSKYWVTFFTSLLGSILIAIGEGFKKSE